MAAGGCTERLEGRMRAVELEAGDLRLVVLPELGGGIARFDLPARPKGVIPLFRTWMCTAPIRTGSAATCSCFRSRPDLRRRHRGRRPLLAARYPTSPAEPVPDSRRRLAAGLDRRGRTSRTALGPRAREPPRMPPFAYRAGLRLRARRTHALRSPARRSGTGARSRVPYGLGFHPGCRGRPATTLQAAAEAVWLERPNHPRTDACR